MKTCYTTNYQNKEYFKETEFDLIDENRVNIQVNQDDVKQTLVGFGGAFTEAAAATYHRATPEIQQQIIKMYFDEEEGLGYELGRMTINSCDFSLSNYTYIKAREQTLKTFSIHRELKHVVPMIKDAMKYAKNLEMKAAPWSPPRHMKSNNDMNYGGKLLKAYYDFWANYLIKYIEVMKEQGIDIEYLSIQNEPEAVQVWDSCVYTPEEMADFVKILGPKLKKKNIDVKIVVLDHNRDILEKWATSFANDEEALKYTWGLGIHWYVSEDFEALSRAKQIAPSLEILFTEGCIEGGPRPYDISTGERYARNIIGDLNHGCVGFIDWNLLLNKQGGPNHVGNYCDAPMLLANNELIVNSSYYYIGHFAKYLRRGSKILSSSVDDSKLQVLAGINPKGQKIVIIVNPNDEKCSYTLNGFNEKIEGIIFGHTIQTWVIEE